MIEHAPLSPQRVALSIASWHRALRSVVAVVSRITTRRHKPTPATEPSRKLSTEYILVQVLDEESHEHFYPFHQAGIVAGLHQNQCWQTCLENETHTYALARVVILYARYYHHRKKSMSRDETVSGALALINAWLKPAMPWTIFPDEMTICSHIFGVAWASMFSENIASDLHGPLPEAGSIAYTTRPPFLPGLCPSKSETAILGVTLPELDSSS